MQATKNKGRLPISLKIGYGMGSLGENVAYNVFYTFFLLYMTNYAGVNAGIAITVKIREAEGAPSFSGLQYHLELCAVYSLPISD